MTRAACVGVDWGTTSLRLWAFDETGSVMAEARSADGMSRLKPDMFAPLLEKELAAMGVAHDVPVIACGMVGAAQGWVPAPYVDVCSQLDAIVDGAVKAPSARSVYILPGVAQREGAPDVIRGEETMLLGALESLPRKATVCLPGTHSKWVQVESGFITSFRTAMVGELYEMLSKHSTLSHYLDAGGTPSDAAFDQAVREALGAPTRLLSALFSVRAMPLLRGDEQAKDMPDRLSGLLIGTEIASALLEANRSSVQTVVANPQAHRLDAPTPATFVRLGSEDPELSLLGRPITVIASGALGERYARAFTVAGCAFQLFDAELAVQHGLLRAARSLLPDRFNGAGTKT